MTKYCQQYLGSASVRRVLPNVLGVSDKILPAESIQKPRHCLATVCSLLNQVFTITCRSLLIWSPLRYQSKTNAAPVKPLQSFEIVFPSHIPTLTHLKLILLILSWSSFQTSNQVQTNNPTIWTCTWNYNYGITGPNFRLVLGICWFTFTQNQHINTLNPANHILDRDLGIRLPEGTICLSKKMVHKFFELAKIKNNGMVQLEAA